MSAAQWFIAAVIAAAVSGTALALVLARYLYNRDVARWNAGSCRWCGDRKSPASTPCTCVKPCGRSYCQAPDRIAAEQQQGIDLAAVLRDKFHDLDADLDKILKDGEGRG